MLQVWCGWSELVCLHVAAEEWVNHTGVIFSVTVPLGGAAGRGRKETVLQLIQQTYKGSQIRRRHDVHKETARRHRRLPVAVLATDPLIQVS